MQLKKLITHLGQKDSITVRIKRDASWKPDFTNVKQVISVDPFGDLECLGGSKTHLVVELTREMLNRQMALKKGDIEINTPDEDFVTITQSKEDQSETKEKRFPTLDEFSRL